ncbi:MAG: glycosyltransferase family 4 protein [Candidatus Moraniibacteriota bacterium]
MNTEKKIKLLFISRAYPPVLGGIEMQNYGIAKSLSELTETKIIANKHGKKFLPLFLPWVVLKSLFILSNYDVVLFGDGVLTPLGVFLRFFYPKKKFISIIHGLDITFAYKKSILGKIFRSINIPAQKRMDKLIMVGNETINQAVKIGIQREKCVFIPNGMDVSEKAEPHERKELEALLNMPLDNKRVIFRGGRFVKHKGVEWFIRTVMPKLPENYILVAAGGVVARKTVGDENYYPKCLQAIKGLGLENRVKLFPNLLESKMRILFNTVDLYISPNIKVPGSMEGFGITAIEGSGCGRVVLASNLEGLKDAIINGKNGFLVDPGNADAWSKKIKEVLEDDNFRKEFGQKAQEFVIANFTWKEISRKYLEVIRKVTNN